MTLKKNSAYQLSFLIAYLLCAPWVSSAEIVQNNQFAHLDWHPNSADTPILCRGGYVEPKISFLRSDVHHDDQTIYAEADTSSANLPDGIAALEGGVIIQQGNRLFRSGYGEVNSNTNTAFLEDSVTFREPGLLMRGVRAETDFSSSISRFHKAELVMHQQHLRGSADTITRLEDSNIHIDQGTITYCEPGNNAWAIESSDITLHTEEGYGIARHTTFRVADVPILYLPWFRFPIDDRRQSGFLYPSLRVSQSNGVDLSLPYYFNISPNFDATVTPRFIEKRGLLVESEFRYLNRWSHNALSLAYLPKDKKRNDDNRWLFNLKHQGNPADRWETQIDYTKVSDDDYFANLNTSLDVQRQDHLKQQTQIGYQGNGWNFSANLHQYQTISGVTPYQRSPQLLFTGAESLGRRTNFNYTAEYVRFDTSDSRSVHAHRAHIRPTIGYRTSKPWGYSNAEFTLWHSSYSYFNKPAGDASNSLTAIIGSVDSGLYFDRDFSIGDRTYSQSLEPRLMLLHSKKSDSNNPPKVFDSSQMSFSYNNLFDRYGWSGNDRVSATSQATLGVSSALYNDSGRENARIAIAQSYYIEDREPSDLRPGDISGIEKSSNIALLAQWDITPHIRVRHDSEIDREDFSFEEQNYQLTWRPGTETFLYFSYRDRINSAIGPDARTRQSDIAFRNQLNPQWAVIGRWQHDIVRQQRLDTLLGLEYGTCCWKMRLTAREYLSPDKRGSTATEYDRGVFLQFVLRGLGSFGGDGGRSLMEEITGFRERDHDNF